MAHVKTDEERGQPGAWLYHARNALGLSHGQVAAANDVSVSAIVKAEGKRPPEGQASRSLQDRLIAYYRSLARERPDVLLPELPPDRESSDRGGSAAPDLVELVGAINRLVDELGKTRQEQARWNAGVERVIEELAARLSGRPTEPPELQPLGGVER